VNGYADGNGNTVVDASDYSVWKSHYGATFPAPGSGLGSGGLTAELVATSHDAPSSTTLGIPTQRFAETSRTSSADFAILDPRVLRVTVRDVTTGSARTVVDENSIVSLGQHVRQDAGCSPGFQVSQPVGLAIRANLTMRTSICQPRVRTCMAMWSTPSLRNCWARRTLQ